MVQRLAREEAVVARVEAQREAVAGHLVQVLRRGDLLITLGAGDVWKIGEQVLEKLRASGS